MNPILKIKSLVNTFQLRTIAIGRELVNVKITSYYHIFP